MILFYIKTIFLGILEGLTEFIPVSSTAHLLIFQNLIHFDSATKNVFVIFIQLGAILAVCYEYKALLFGKIINLFKFNDKEEQKKSFNFAKNILIAILPFGIGGLLLYDQIKSLFDNKHIFLIIGITLILGGFAFLLTEKTYNKKDAKITNIDQIGFKESLYIGLFQLLSFIPGISRSGATIVGGLKSNLNRKIATEFSFFLAIPVMFGAVMFDLYKNWSIIHTNNLITMMIGFIFAYITSLIIIRWVINYIQNKTFNIFAKYRIIFGSVCVLYYILA